MWKNVIIHIGCWLALTLYMFNANYEHYSLEFEDGFIIIKNISNTLVITITFYLNYFILTPKALIQNKKYLLFGIGFFLLLVIDALLINLQAFVHDLILGKARFFPMDFKDNWTGLLSPILFISLGTGIRFGQQYYTEEKDKKELEKQMAKAELSLLRSQINPHFMYNSLNNIYALSQKKSELTSESILKLSDTMRYYLSVSEKSKVSLIKELTFLNDYISLQKLRIINPELVSFIPLPEKDIEIPPLLLITFVENAFKHSDLVNMENPIDMKLKLDENQLFFRVTNEIGNIEKDKSSGIGISNLRKRLSILYPDKHSIETTSKGDLFIATLTIEI